MTPTPISTEEISYRKHVEVLDTQLSLIHI